MNTSKPDNTEIVFGQDYADCYDLFYQDKNYEAECDMIVEVFRRYSNGDIKTILDLGCGTGNHAIPLARRGYHVTGVDMSLEMLRHAEDKTATLIAPNATAWTEPVFLEGDIRTLDLNKKYDAVLMMFAVLGYQLTNDDVLAALQTVRSHLNPGGLVICDVWYGPAVLTIRPGQREKVIPTAEGKIIRIASGSLEVRQHLATVHYHIIHFRNDQAVHKADEFHKMRFFFPQELSLFMKYKGLELIDLFPFGDLTKCPDETTWNIVAVAKAKIEPDNIN